jgi:molecular chaperone DnaJ
LSDPYAVLGVAKSATPDEIRTAFRKLARQHHPDLNQDDPSAEERFKEVNEAYGILSDPEKRARFDQYGSVDGPAQNPGGYAEGGIADIFDAFFGGAQASARSRGTDGDDHRVNMTITLEEVLTGVEREASFRRMEECGRCGASGAEPGTEPETCRSCQGRGQVERIAQTFIGSVRTSTTCPACRGRGKLIQSPCTDCRGRRLRPQTATVSISVPAGIEAGQVIAARGEGSAGLDGGAPGDLYVVVDVEEGEKFRREGQDLYAPLRLSVSQAALGAELTFETLDGPLEVKIPAGIQPGQTLSFRGKGLPSLRSSGRGSLMLQAEIIIPQKLTSRQKELFQELAAEMGEAPGEEGGGLFGFFKKK